MGMMSELDIDRQNAEFEVPRDDDFNEFYDTSIITEPKSANPGVRFLQWNFTEAGNLQIMKTPTPSEHDQGPTVDLPAEFAQPLRALLFGE